MAYPRRATVCVSTQAGCAMGCPFCATGQGGFIRHLAAARSSSRWLGAMRATGRPVTHVVFMGMGEPLANYDQTWGAVRRLHDDMGLSARRLTISTVGIIPGIRKMAAEALPVNLAISLHAANDELRDELVPINRATRWPRSCRGLRAPTWRRTSRRLSFEWALIGGVNDCRRDAAELAALRAPARRAREPDPPQRDRRLRRGRHRAPGGAPVRRAWLADDGVVATVRVTRGADIAAACGQLAGAPG